MNLEYEWDADKNDWLKATRGISFEQVTDAIANGRLLADVPNPSQRYAHQRRFVVDIGGYAIVVPYVQNGGTVFLKTAYPDRRATRKYLGG